MEVAAVSSGHDGSHCQNAADASPWRMALGLAEIRCVRAPHGAPRREPGGSTLLAHLILWERG